MPEVLDFDKGLNRRSFQATRSIGSADVLAAELLSSAFFADLPVVFALRGPEIFAFGAQTQNEREHCNRYDEPRRSIK
jgi:hypothetical protein